MGLCGWWGLAWRKLKTGLKFLQTGSVSDKR